MLTYLELCEILVCNFCICPDLRSKSYQDFEVTAPDSITSWMASAFVISEDFGLGLTTNPAEVVTEGASLQYNEMRLRK